MGEVKNLKGKAAIEKIKELAEEKMCLLCTQRKDGSLVSRPMSTAQVDDQGFIWFFSPKDSGKNKEISQNPIIYLMYMEAGKQHYLTLRSKAMIVYDKNKVEQLWNPFLKAWFTEGKDDPNISLLKIDPEEGHYWDEKDGKLVSMIKTGIAALTGTKGLDGSLQGDIKL